MGTKSYSIYGPLKALYTVSMYTMAAQAVPLDRVAAAMNHSTEVFLLVAGGIVLLAALVSVLKWQLRIDDTGAMVLEEVEDGRQTVSVEHADLCHPRKPLVPSVFCPLALVASSRCARAPRSEVPMCSTLVHQFNASLACGITANKDVALCATLTCFRFACIIRTWVCTAPALYNGCSSDTFVSEFNREGRPTKRLSGIQQAWSHPV